jgi:hypothetical protein
MEIVGVITLLPADQQNVAKTPCRDQRYAASLALEYGIGGDRGGMQDIRYRCADQFTFRRTLRSSVTALAGARGVVGTFQTFTKPVLVSRRAKSVKVPPISNASCIAFSDSRFPEEDSWLRMSRQSRIDGLWYAIIQNSVWQASSSGQGCL